MHRGPKSRDPHQEVTVAAYRHRQPAGTLERERGTHGDAGAAADAATAIATEEVEGVSEWPPGAIPRQREVQKRRLAAADGLAKRKSKILDAERPGVARLVMGVPV